MKYLRFQKNRINSEGFTPTPTFLQSFVSKIKKSVSCQFEKNTTGLERREQSSQHESWCRGFTLVETLVAITILLLVIIGPLTISSSSVKGTAFASEQVVAFFLAQEGAELIQKGRDEFVLEHLKNSASRPNPWADFINQNGAFRNCYSANGCNLIVNTDAAGSLTAPRSCSGQDSCLVRLDTSTGVVRSRFGAVNTGVYSVYTRKVRLQVVSANEVSITSTVSWRSGFSREEQQVVVQNSLFNVYGTN